MNQPTPLERILIVEDDDTARHSLVHVLERVQYNVSAVADGETALDYLSNPAPHGTFAVVITDLLMGEVDGLAVLRAARNLAEPPEVILLTGYGTLQTAIESLRSGVFDYLLKPAKPEELLRCVASAIQRFQERRNEQTAMQFIAEGLAQLQAPPNAALATPSDAGRMLQIGALVIDEQAYQVTFHGQPLTLTPTEYALLVCLGRSNGRILTYVQLAQHIYSTPMESHMAHQLLKTHIYNLRHKIDPAYIINVRSTGYRLIDPNSTAGGS